ncbi:flagellar biosynthetic protein FliO [Vibrio sp. VB16]|uniref:flagellar biosynthetic protein FliO n=1 Tax=Vibrio sp. VB16 TaxID=2785746 RepID=UPI00189FD525|nr:flagellar biosynthetic protein FliO [Vibrio sp. VB16]UGA53999.1 flagellar biosynthetic protein FliO [Vibrio sp. VB16]
MTINRTLASTLFFLPFPVLAAGAPQLDLLTTFGSLAVVIAIIFALAWLLKKMRLPTMGNQKGLSVVRQISVGTRERIAVIKVGEEQFLVGITSQAINLISRLDKPIDDEQIETSQFASQFSQLLKKNDKK